MLLYSGFGFTRLMASCRTSTRGLGKLVCVVLWPVLDHSCQPCMRWYAYDVYAFTVTTVFQCLYYSEILCYLDYLSWSHWSVYCDVPCYFSGCSMRTDGCYVLPYDAFSYSWRTDAIMMIILWYLSVAYVELRWCYRDSVIWWFHA